MGVALGPRPERGTLRVSRFQAKNNPAHLATRDNRDLFFKPEISTVLLGMGRYAVVS
jgi:hypothetical protein